MPLRTILDLYVDQGDHSRPCSHPGQRKDHLGQDAAVQLHEDGPFGVLSNISRAAEVVVKVQRRVLAAEWVRCVNTR